HDHFRAAVHRDGPEAARDTHVGGRAALTVPRRTAPTAEGVVVAAVAPRTAAARAGLRPGDRILAINGSPLRDVIDFHFHAGEEALELAVEREGRPHRA